MAVWPNGSRTRPKLSSLWKEYDGQPAPQHFGLDSYGYKYNCAIDAGVISKIGWNTYGGGGREIYLRLDNGDVILYYHNDIAALVRVGQRVVAGQRLGLQGSTGKTYGIHLHIEVWKGGFRSSRVNPLTYITALVGSSTAGGEATPISTTSEGDSMPAVIERTEGTPEWSLVWPSLAGPSAIERGYIVTRDRERAQWWERFYELGYGTADKFGRDEYIEAQKFARLDHAAWLAGQPATATPAVIDYEKLAGLIKFPTAAENGDAARAAIVKS